MTIQTDAIQQATANLAAEFVEVRQVLADAVAELQPPLGELVYSQLQHSLLARRAGLVLTAGIGAAPSPRTREQRVLVAAATEMLYLALGIHQLLLTGMGAGREKELEKSWVGGVILAGDYCFSRSAILTAQTENPQIVEIFARSLKAVSEGLLRQLFGAEADTGIANALVEAGFSSVAILAGHDPQTAMTVATLNRLLLPTADQLVATQVAPLIDQLPGELQPAWQAFIRWQPALEGTP